MSMREITKKARELAEVLKRQDEVLVVTHTDADGITSGSIALESLNRIGIECDIEFVKQLDEKTIEKIADKGKFVWFTDLGSGSLGLIIKHKIDCVITDHHDPDGYYRFQLNPHDFKYSGTYDLCGSTTTYLVAKNLGFNYDLVSIAIVGAVGDLQDSKECRLIGLNREILLEGVRGRYIDIVKDLRFFGKQTRPVYKMLEYTFDPYLPGISGNEKGAIEFLESLGIPLKEDDKWRRWIDLSKDEKRTIVSALIRICIDSGVPLNTIKRLVGETYILLREEEGTELRDAMEYSTLLNATARYGECEIGLKVCLGDRGEAFRRARNLLMNHRKNILEGLKLVDEIGITELEHIQYFHAGNEILDTVVGIVAGMCFSKANLNKPIIAFAYTDDGVKVSARATQRLVERGVNLAKAIRIAAEKVGGSGGGHDIAAGALIPRGTEDEFLKILDELIGQQLKG